LSSIELISNKKLSIPASAIAAMAMTGNVTTAYAKQPSPEAMPQIRPLTTFNWLSQVNWGIELKDHIPFESIKPFMNKPPQKLTPAQEEAKLVSPTQRREWNKVHNCENPWNYNDNISSTSQYRLDYSGGLDIMEANWIAYGGLRYAVNPGRATPDRQIIIARDIQYPDSFSISQTEWEKYGGTKLSPTFSRATNDQRRAIEENIAPNIPDQDGGACVSW
jgi:hypothetical protein